MSMEHFDEELSFQHEALDWEAEDIQHVPYRDIRNRLSKGQLEKLTAWEHYNYVETFQKNANTLIDERLAKKPLRAEKKSKRGRKPQLLDNPHTQFLQHYIFYYEIPWPLDDLIRGACAADTGGDKPLSVTKMFSIISNLNPISAEGIQDMFALSERQAQKYLAASRIILQHIHKAI